MYEPRPSDITLPTTISVDLTHLLADAVEAATSEAERADESERVA